MAELCFWTDVLNADQVCAPGPGPDPGGDCIVFTAVGGEPLWTDDFGDEALLPSTQTGSWTSLSLNGYARPPRDNKFIGTITVSLSVTLMASQPGAVVHVDGGIGGNYFDHTLQLGVPHVIEGTFTVEDEVEAPNAFFGAWAEDNSTVTAVFDVSEVEVCYRDAPLFVRTRLAKVNLDGTYDTSFPIFGGDFHMTPLADGSALLLGGVYGGAPTTREGVQLPQHVRIDSVGNVIMDWGDEDGLTIYSTLSIEPDRLDFRQLLSRWNDDIGDTEYFMQTPTGGAAFTFPSPTMTLAYVDTADRRYFVTPGPNASGSFSSHTQYIDRYLPDGTIDPTFTRITRYSGANNRVASILNVVEMNGMLYVFHATIGNNRGEAARYTLAGALDLAMSTQLRPNGGSFHPRPSGIWQGRLVYTRVMVDGIYYTLALFDEDFVLDTTRSVTADEAEVGPAYFSYLVGQYAANVSGYGEEPSTRVYLGTDLPLTSVINLNYTDRSVNEVLAAPGFLWKPLQTGYWEI